MISTKNIYTLLIGLLIICAVNFFGLQIIKGSFVRYIQFGYMSLIIVLALPYVFNKGDGFVLPVKLIFFSVLASVFIPLFTRGQGLFDTLIGTIPVLILVFFFYLKRIVFPIERIEKLVIGYGVLYLVLYLFQFTHPNSPYFIDPETIDYSRGILRIVFPGRGLFYLTVFIAINRLTASKKYTWFWLFFSLAGVVVTIMQVTRQFIVALLVIYFYHFLKDLNWLKKGLIISMCIALGFYIYQSNNPIVEGLRYTQEQTEEQGSDYVRIQAAIFFLKDFSKNGFTRIFGNGVPYGDNSPYLNEIGRYVTSHGYWLSDVGIVAVYAMFGIFSVIGYLIIWIKSFTIGLPREFFYLKYYLWFLLMTCLTSDTIYSPNDLICMVLVLYIYQIIYELGFKYHIGYMEEF